MKHEVIPCEQQLYPGIDRNDPEGASSAIELQFPDTFSQRAKRVIRYIDGAIYLYAYKGRFVVTDESLELTINGDGTHESPLGGPRWVGDSLEELEEWLESVADEYDRLGDIPGWNTAPAKLNISYPEELLNHVLVTLSADEEFVRMKTYDRKHGGKGRFLINRITIKRLLEELKSPAHYDSDCGNYAAIIRLENSLKFCFVWLDDYSDGTVEGFRQNLTVPLSKIRPVLYWSESVKHLYIPPDPTARIIAAPAAEIIHGIVKNRLLRRAFSKAMRDSFRWPGEEVTLFPDGRYSFCFTTKSGFPKIGGLILHEGLKNGYPYLYYSIHT